MKAELKLNTVNQVLNGTDIYEKGDDITSIGLVVKGRVCIHTEGLKVFVGSGTFLGLPDLPAEIHSVTYTAETNTVIYAFPAMRLSQAVRSMVSANKDYGPVMVSTLSKYIRDLSVIYEELEEKVDTYYEFIKEKHQLYLDIANEAGVRVDELQSVIELEEYDHAGVIDFDELVYYRTCCEIPSEVQKAYYGHSSVITMYHVMEQVSLIRLLIDQCVEDAEYLKQIGKILVQENRGLYSHVLKLATAKQNMGADMTSVMSLFDDIIDKINTLENLLNDKASIDLEVNHDFMEKAYFSLMNGGESSPDNSIDSDLFALVEEGFTSVEELQGSLDQILDYSDLDIEAKEQLRKHLEDFAELPDKASTEDEVRKLRQGIMKIYYKLYKSIFLRDYREEGETPLVIDLFLRYGFLSEKLVTETMMEELLSLNTSHSGVGACAVYDMKEWLTEIYEGKKEPSKSEFDLDYSANLREMKKTGRITKEEQTKLEKDLDAKLDYEINNMFKTNHRLIFGQVSIFVPFLYKEGCVGSLKKNFLAKDKINAAVHKLQQIDYSVFYRESLYIGENPAIKKEYIMEEVFPDFILFPTVGSNSVMWQEISGRRRNTPGRFLLPMFMETDIDTAMIKLFGRFRWELCRTIQGAAWNNIQIKSLTSEYSDFIQFYRKNRDLSDEKKDKLKLQIQKARNNTREVFVVDYENWIKHEAHGGLCLSKPVREILAMYCPFTKKLRENVSEQPLFRDAMARFVRERGKKTKEYDLKYRVWEKEQVDIPDEIRKTRDFYVEM